MDSTAHTLIIGAGIVGCSTAYHLAQLGVTDVLVIEQGPLFATGGSTSHAPGLVFQTSGSQTMSELARYTVDLFSSKTLDGKPCFHQVGGVEVATTQRRWDDLKRKVGLAEAWGIPAELLGPAEVHAKIPQIDPDRILGGLHTPTDGIAKPVRAAEAMAREAQRLGVRFVGNTEVTGFEVDDGLVSAVHTSQGTVEVQRVLCAAGIWGPTLGKLAGVSVPVQPVAHQYAVTSSVPGLGSGSAEAAQPMLRHQDCSMYFRQIHDRYGIGSYAHRVIPVEQDEIKQTAAPGNGAEAPSEGGGWKGMSTVHPFTPEDFDGPWLDARDLVPPLESTQISEGMNGLFLFTADGNPVLGPTREVENFWLGEAVWITHSGGVGKALAEWMAGEVPSIDLRSADVRRFERLAHAPSFVRERSSQTFREVYDVIHPQQPSEQARPARTSPFYLRERELGAVFLEANGWERPHWFESNAALADGISLPEPGEWAGKYLSPTVAAEHLNTRRRGGIYDMTSLARAEVTGRGALATLQRLTTGNLDRKPGYVTYTLMLEDTGGVRADITVARLGRDHFQVGLNGQRDIAWLQANADETTSVRDTTGGTCCIGLWGPRARDVLQPLASEDIGHEAFRFFRAKQFYVAEVPVTALRLSYVGELGWEIYTSAEYGLRLWDLLTAAGAEHGVVPSGRGAFNAMRIEKGYRAWGSDMWSLHYPDEAGLSFAVKPDKGDFVGRDALLRRRERPFTRQLRCLTIDDGAVLMGSEAVYAPEGRKGQPVGFTTSTAYGHSVGSSLAFAWLPAEVAEEGSKLEVSYFDQRHPATVVSDPILDPEMTRMRC